MNTQDANSPVMEQLIMFYDHTMKYCDNYNYRFMYMMMSLVLSKLINRMLLEGQLIELIWTNMPAILLIFIGLPSLKFYMGL